MTKCNRPTLDVTISPDGNFRICCYGTTLGNIEGQTIREFFNSDAVKEISNTLNSGTRHSYCSACWNLEDLGHDSYRLVSEPYKSEGGFPAMLDIKFNNICNLACKMCDPVSSSKLATEWKQLGWTDQNTPYLDTNSKTILPDWQNTNYQTNKINKIWDEIIDNIKFVKRIKFTGGEPFMTKEILQFLKRIPVEDRKHIDLKWTTNGTQDLSNWESTLLTFKANSIGISCDGEQDTYNYIRYPGTWTEWLESSKKIMDKYQSHINFTVTVFNIFNLKKFVSWAQSNGYLNKLRFAYENIPLVYAPMVLPRYLRVRAVEDIMYAIKNMDKSGVRMQLRAIADHLHSINDDVHNKHWHHFLKITHQQDKHRDMSITNIWPDVPEVRERKLPNTA